MSMKKLALVTAMFAATSGAFAMEALDEEALAATTGQDGITIGINTQANLDVVIHDKGGFGATATDDGAIVLTGVGLTAANGVDDAQIAIDIDAGTDSVNGAALNIGIELVNSVAVDLGELSVAESLGIAAATTTQNDSGVLLNLGTLTLAAGATVNLQLGHEYQGHLINIDANLTGGLSLTGVSLNDLDGLAGSAVPALATGGSISIGTLTVVDTTGGTDLLVDLGIDATSAGLAVSVGSLGNGGMTVKMTDVALGSATPIGDVEIRGLDLTGDVITISGH